MEWIRSSFSTRGTIEAAIVQDVCAALGFEIIE